MEQVEGCGLVGWIVDEDGTWTVFFLVEGTLMQVKGTHSLVNVFDRLPKGLKTPTELIIIA